MPSRRLALAVAATMLAMVGLTPAAASAGETTGTPSATALDNARVPPAKPYAAGAGRKN
jgi:hypothetical protein